MTKKIYIFALIIICFFSLANVQAQKNTDPEPEPPLTRILFVFDASQSMYARWQSDMRITIARTLLSELLDSLENTDNLELALRVYGHQKKFPPQDCDDTRLEIPFAPDNASRIRHRLRTITPKGTTPIAMSLEAARHDFTPCDNCRNIIVLITDGIEECGGDPCVVSRALQKDGITLKPFVIGIGRDFKNEFDCVGEYFDATSENEFRESLKIVISQALDNTTAQVNLLDINKKPTESNVPITFYDKMSGKILKNIIHTINVRGNPDTLYYFDPLVTYNMVVHTIPPIHVNDISINAGKHNIIAADAPQGSLSLAVGGRTPMNYYTIIRKAGENKTLHIQQFSEEVKYLIGKYDLEILSLPRIIIKDVDIKQSHNTKVEIPGPGIAVIRLSAPGFAKLFEEKENELKEVYTFRDGILNETLYLQPGRYRVVYRSRASTSTVFTQEKSFNIDSGSTVTVQVN
ncbi:MAG: vWA domain-containing protein [Bacteroidota bacterium]